jgi:hypothetical protein
MNCNICNKPIVLSPSAAERAAKDVTGKSAAYYTKLFRTHATCALEKRARDTSELIKRIALTAELERVVL